jgi:hypothetical protein
MHVIYWLLLRVLSYYVYNNIGCKWVKFVFNILRVVWIQQNSYELLKCEG